MFRSKIKSNHLFAEKLLNLLYIIAVTVTAIYLLAEIFGYYRDFEVVISGILWLVVINVFSKGLGERTAKLEQE
jgi:hypothetical protein